MLSGLFTRISPAEPRWQCRFGRCIQPPVPAAARHRLFCAAFNYCVLAGWNMQSKCDRIENETPGEEKDNVEG